MTSVLDIDRAISALSPTELAELYTWMDEDRPIDVQLKADLDGGLSDNRIARALAGRRAGKTQPL
jgi:hypothetical protein